MPKPRAKSKPKPRSKPKHRSKPKSKPRSKPKPRTKPRAKPKPRSKPKPRPKPRSKPKQIVKSRLISKTIPKQISKPKSISKPLNQIVKSTNTIERIQDTSDITYENNLKEVKSIKDLDDKSYMKMRYCLEGMNAKVFHLKDKTFDFLYSPGGDQAIKLIKQEWTLNKPRTFFKLFDSLPSDFDKNVLPGGVQNVFDDAFLALFINYLLPEKACSNILHNIIAFYYEDNLIYSKLKYYKIDGNLKENLKNCKERFYFINVNIHGISGGHRNNIIVDKYQKQVVLFEPHGVSVLPISLLKKIFNDDLGLNDYSIIETANTCINPKVQGLTNDERDQYCVSWSAYFGFMKLLNPELSDEQIIGIMTQKGRDTFRDIQSLTYIIQNSFNIDNKEYYKFNKIVFDSDKCYLRKNSYLHREMNAGYKVNYYSFAPKIQQAENKLGRKHFAY